MQSTQVDSNDGRKNMHAESYWLEYVLELRSMSYIAPTPQYEHAKTNIQQELSRKPGYQPNSLLSVFIAEQHKIVCSSRHWKKQRRSTLSGYETQASNTHKTQSHKP